MEQGNNNREKDDSRFLGGKDKKKDKKYYGKFLIFIIFVILCIEYYAYVFEVMIKYILWHMKLLLQWSHHHKYTP